VVGDTLREACPTDQVERAEAFGQVLLNCFRLMSALNTHDKRPLALKHFCDETAAARLWERTRLGMDSVTGRVRSRCRSPPKSACGK
jgi:hypothetical protein